MSSHAQQHKGNGVIMLATGLKNVLNLKPEDINIWDWAWGLSNQARWSGATLIHWSVLSHLGLVYELAARDKGGVDKLRLIDQAALLLHDAAEGYLVDFPRPIKYIPEAKFFRETEERILRLILQRFGIDFDAVDWDMVHRYDNQALAIEFATFWPHMARDPFAPKFVYAQEFRPGFSKARPSDYVAKMRDIFINLQTGANIRGLFDIPQNLEELLEEAPRPPLPLKDLGVAAPPLDATKEPKLIIHEDIINQELS